jgi:hypothetical protein
LYWPRFAVVNRGHLTGKEDVIYILALILLPPLLVFGVYHLSLWCNVMAIQGRVFWRRVALASAISHLLLVIGFFLFSYVDYRLNRNISGAAAAFDMFLFNRSPFWSLLLLFDTAAMVLLLGVFGALDWLGISIGITLSLTSGIVLLAGTLQWYWIGGAIGAGLERLWSGLKGPDDEPGSDRAGWL